jgi:serine/threonine-protein kinase
VQVCQAVEYAHSRGVIHCDLKPANILLGAFGEVIVVDWGLAYSESEGLLYRGGTPGYMAPEQLDRARKTYDPRTDVFALGCILYEVLTLKQPFHITLDAIISKQSPFVTPERPSKIAPERKVPVDLEDIAMAALALDPTERTASAREMASALEAVIEGTKEQERRRRRANELAAEGDDLAKSHFDYWRTRPQQVTELEAIRSTMAPSAPPSEKTRLWEAEDRLAVDDSLGGRILQASISAYEQALAQIPDHAGARSGLAQLYYGELLRAREERRDKFNQLYLEELVRLYDDGTIAHAIEAESHLSVDATPGAEQVTLLRLEERERRLVELSRTALGPTPIARVPLETGFYTLVFHRTGCADVRYPFYVAQTRTIDLHIDLAPAASLAPDEIYVPGGPALIGGTYSVSSTQGTRSVEVDGFVIAERPVTVGEYLAFVEDAFAESPETASAHLPQRPDGAPYWKRSESGQLVPCAAADWGAPGELRLLPVFGVDATSAEAYAAWRSRKTGKRYRLPREHEWEKAARGTDGRSYPWGDIFDASFCKMRDSRPTAPKPEPSGAFATDISPYGVRDMAGGIAEWVVPASEVYDSTGGRLMVTRGGAWCDWQADCLLASRRPAWASERAARVGFRLARDA